MNKTFDVTIRHQLYCAPNSLGEVEKGLTATATYTIEADHIESAIEDGVAIAKEQGLDLISVDACERG